MTEPSIAAQVSTLREYERARAMKHWIGELIGVNLRELENARLAGTFPFTATLINRMIAEQLPPRGALAALVLEIHDGDELTAHVRLHTPLVPPFTVKGRLEGQPDPARGVPLVLRWWIDGLAAVSPLIGMIARRVSSLPPWVRIDGDRAEIDIGGLIDERGFGEIVPYVKSLHVSTAEGRVVLEFEMRT